MRWVYLVYGLSHKQAQGLAQSVLVRPAIAVVGVQLLPAIARMDVGKRAAWFLQFCDEISTIEWHSTAGVKHSNAPGQRRHEVGDVSVDTDLVFDPGCTDSE